MELQIEHIQHYPIGGENAIQMINIEDSEILTVTGLYQTENNELVFFANGTEWNATSNIILLLRPMSDLYKEIEGKIGIVELYKLLCKENDIEESDTTKVSSNRLIVGKHSAFYYNKGSFRYQLYSIDIPIRNQLRLFQWLFANHYDIFDLISQGLAIDINTI